MTSSSSAASPPRAGHGPVRFVLAALAVTLALAGCANPRGIAPTARPVDPVALAGTTHPAAPRADWPAEDWWQAMGDPELDRVVRAALENAPSLRVARARVARARAAVESADAARMPRLDGAYDATRQRYTGNGIVPRPLAGSVQWTNTLQLGGTWEPDLFGRQRAVLDAAVGSARAAEADARAARLLLASNVARAWVQLARLQDLRDLLLRTRAQRQSILDLVRGRVAAGLDTRVELRQAEGALPQVNQDIEAVDEQIALARHALAALAGQGPDRIADAAPSLARLSTRPLPAVLPAELLERRPDLVAARWRVRAALEDVEAARAQFMPGINLAAFAGFSSLGFSRLLEGGSAVWGVGPAIRLPILDAGRLRANLAARGADADAAVETWNGALVDAVREVADQVATRRSVERQAAEQRAAQAAADEALELATKRYEGGLGTYLVVLNAETTVLAQRRAAVDLHARALDAQVQLTRALGGGVEPLPLDTDTKEYER